MRPTRTAAPATSRAVVESMLRALADGDVDAAGALLAPDVVYSNVGLPTLRGRRRSMAALRLLDRPGRSFEVYLHAVAEDGAVVLTERTDVLCLGPVRLQFWVSGRFDVRDGQITLWRDAFDYLDMTRSLFRGLLGALVPALRPAAPRSLDTLPGRH